MPASKSKDTVFTGQKLVKGFESVLCEVCHKQIALRTSKPEDTGLAWFDPYNNGGKYVHRNCLSQKRKDEIAESERKLK